MLYWIPYYIRHTVKENIREVMAVSIKIVGEIFCPRKTVTQTALTLKPCDLDVNPSSATSYLVSFNA